MGLTRADLVNMPWGELILMMQAKADQYDESDSGTREATWGEVQAWI